MFPFGFNCFLILILISSIIFFLGTLLNILVGIFYPDYFSLLLPLFYVDYLKDNFKMFIFMLTPIYLGYLVNFCLEGHHSHLQRHWQMYFYGFLVVGDWGNCFTNYKDSIYNFIFVLTLDLILCGFQDYTCPRCCSGFIEALDGQPTPADQGDESDEDIDIVQPWEVRFYPIMTCMYWFILQAINLLPQFSDTEWCFPHGDEWRSSFGYKETWKRTPRPRWRASSWKVCYRSIEIGALWQSLFLLNQTKLSSLCDYLMLLCMIKFFLDLSYSLNHLFLGLFCNFWNGYTLCSVFVCTMCVSIHILMMLLQEQ